VGQLGLVVGPALVGGVTAVGGSAAGLLVVAALSVVTAVGAWRRVVFDGSAAMKDSEGAMSRRIDQT
jgi:hypothetical protein